jgi:hypothetical protein
LEETIEAILKTKNRTNESPEERDERDEGLNEASKGVGLSPTGDHEGAETTKEEIREVDGEDAVRDGPSRGAKDMVSLFGVEGGVSRHVQGSFAIADHCDSLVNKLGHGLDRPLCADHPFELFLCECMRKRQVEVGGVITSWVLWPKFALGVETTGDDDVVKESERGIDWTSHTDQPSILSLLH